MRKTRIVASYIICSLAAQYFQPALAQATIQQILNNGPTDKRINIVYLSEGYTNSQLSRYITDATNTLSMLLDTSPYSDYRGYFNAFAISVASTDSGSDHPSRNIFHDTYFNSTYDSYGIARLITVDFVGQLRVDSLIQLLTPDYDIVLMVVNDPEYGGSGGFPAIASVNSASAEIVIHELGHSFGGLGDEYGDPYPGYPDFEEPNTTRETARDSIKWHTWILNGTPIPTPPTSQYGNVVGSFEGAHYHATGWFRPKLNCKMRALGVAFCEVCSETLVKSAYKLVRPIESYSPISPQISLAGSQSVLLSIVPVMPSSHTLSIQWFVDGIQKTGAGSSSFNLLGKELGIGQHTARVVVRDTTSFVRNDLTGLLRDSTTWSILVSGPSLVGSDPSSQLPTQYSLGQNYPNPFNLSTVIRYQIVSSTNVRLKVFNLLGQELATLVNEELNPGTYEVNFDATRLSTGAYFYRLQTDKFIETKMMMVLK